METRQPAWKNPGFVVSAGAHAGMLLWLLVSFSTVPEIADSPETVQVDLVTSDSNDITMGEKIAKVMPTPQRRVDKVAELEDHHPLPPTPQAAKDTPSLDAPDKANDDPGRDAKPPEPVAAVPPPRPPEPPVPTPPARPEEKVEARPVEAPTPPARPVEAATPEPSKPEPSKPEPSKPEPSKPEPSKTAESKPDDDKPDAEAAAPKPPPRPKTPPKPAKERVAEAPVPRPRPVEKKVAKVVPPRKPEPKPEIKPEPPAVPPPAPPEKPSLFDQVASLLTKEKPLKPIPKPRAGDEVKDARPHDDFNPDKISALLDHDVAQRQASTGRAPVRTASLGLPNAHAEKLSPSMAAQIDGWLIDHYRGCWSYFGLGGTKDYVPQLTIRLSQDGSLIGQPALLNPPKDPTLRSLADSAIRAVNKCNPMEIPARFRPYYDQGYKERTVRFDPKELS